MEPPGVLPPLVPDLSWKKSLPAKPGLRRLLGRRHLQDLVEVRFLKTWLRATKGEPLLPWMAEIPHHFETMQNHLLLVLTVECAKRILSIHISEH